MWIPWSAPFCQGPELLPHQLGQRVREHVGQVVAPVTAEVHIAEGVEDGTPLQRSYQHLIGRQIELHLRCRRRGQWTDVGDAALNRRLAPLVLSLPERTLVHRDHEATAVEEPCADLPEDFNEAHWVEVVGPDGEVEVL